VLFFCVVHFVCSPCTSNFIFSSDKSYSNERAR
jgi:hypothetical protein